MSDPNSTEPLSTQADGQPVQPFDQETVDVVSEEDASLTAESSPGAPQSELGDADATDLGQATPAPQYAPPSGGYGATQAYGPAPTYGAPQPYPGGSPGYAPPQGNPNAPQAYPGAPQPYPGGSPGYAPPQAYAPVGPRTNPYAIASLICSLAGLITGVSVIAGIVLGHVALNKIKETGEEGRPLAIAGLAVGYGLLVIGGLLIAGSLVFFALMGTLVATTPSGTF